MPVQVNHSNLPEDVEKIVDELKQEFRGDNSLFVVRSEGSGLHDSHETKIGITMYYPEDPSTYDDPSTRLAKLTSIIERIVSSSDQISNDTYSHKSGVDGSGFPSSVPEEANEETNISLHLY